MTRKYTTYTPEFKFKVALEAAKGQKTISEIATEFDVAPKQVVDWKKELMEAAPSAIYQDKRQRENKGAERERDDLLKKVGSLAMELEWLKKKSL